MATDEGATGDQVNLSDYRRPEDPRLDFYSEKFDPLLALRTDKLKVPVPTAKCHDNLARYETAHDTAKQKSAEQSRLRKQVEAKAGSSNLKIDERQLPTRKFLPHQMPVTVPKQQKQKNNVFTRMEKMEGPLAYLRKCKDERLQVKIWTRHATGIRGFCIAHIVAFDKHWNLALENVTEVWTRLKKSKVPALDSAPNKSFRKVIEPPRITVLETTKKLEICKRNLPQVLLRGEHVAIVCVPEKYIVSQEIKKFIDGFKQ